MQEPRQVEYYYTYNSNGRKYKQVYKRMPLIANPQTLLTTV